MTCLHWSTSYSYLFMSRAHQSIYAIIVIDIPLPDLKLLVWAWLAYRFFDLDLGLGSVQQAS